MADFQQNEIVVTTKAGDEFRFRVPSPRDLAAMGLRARALRRVESPDDPSEWGLDYYTQQLYRAFALFEVLLKKASVAWPWSEREGEKGLVVDSSKFPAEVVPTLLDVHEGFASQLATFHQGGTRDSLPTGAEGVAGQ